MITHQATLTFLKTARCHSATDTIVEAAARAASEVAHEHGLSDREREIVLRLAAGALFWLPRL
jgi:hypothetical protein